MLDLNKMSDDKNKNLVGSFNEAEHEKRIDAIWAVRGKKPELKVQALVDLKNRCKGDEIALALINKNKYSELPLLLMLEELTAPKTTLFTAKQQQEVLPLALRLLGNYALPDDQKLKDLAALKEEYGGNKRCNDLVDSAAFYFLPVWVKSQEVKDPKTNLFSEEQTLSLRGQYKM
jgi:hypothetical protein